MEQSQKPTLLVKVHEYFGRRTIYPACPLSEKFCILLNQKTLTEGDCERIKDLGFLIKTKEEEL